MLDTRISRRAALMGAGAVAAWLASPARALLQTAGKLEVPGFVDTLISRMTLEEKAGQLSLMASAWGGGKAAALNPPSNSNFPQQVEEARRGQLTGVFNGNGARMARIMQNAAVKESRLKIPLIFAADIIHGHRTIFPVPLAEVASFEPDLARRTAEVAAFEAAGAGIDWNFAPMVDVARDQRWGRGVEGGGEDPLLGGLFAAARVKGFQGPNLRSNEHFLACVKHFAAYGAAESGLDYNTVDMSERTLREVYLKTYKDAFDAGALSAMASFNEISGVPATGNHWLLTDVLRGEWGFEGFVVSDYTGDEEMIKHGYAKDGRDAARLAFLAGVDMSMQSGLYRQYLPDLVRSGEVPEETLNTSVRRVLAMKAMLGLFDNPFGRIDEKREQARSLLPRNRAIARESGRKSIVLLKNDGDLLPLPKSGKKIALIGPFASGQHDLVGPWVVYGSDDNSVDLATGVRAAVSDKNSIIIAEGSGVETVIPGGIEQAVAAAQQADIVVLAIGEAQNMSGEAQSRADITVPKPQQELAEAIAKTGKPIVVVLKNGRGLALDGAVANAPAILVTWFLGTETGNSIADVLFGAYSPSGRLPLSFPRLAGQQPYYYAHKPTGRPNPDPKLDEYKAHFRGITNTALYPFGHGLTYGKIEYSEFALSAPTLSGSGEIAVSARITNRGTRAAEEVVQLYTHDRVASVTRPVREMKAFRKIKLEPGQSEVVRFVLRPSDLSFYGLQNKPIVEPGRFDVWIAPSAEAPGVGGSFDLAA
ncbi:glycoside hydrolase family 3 C-terminal domain-containing protein [Sphingomonas sp. SM33]|uniref:beta-glucosidase n=1 Tax=Sphingomonas telluris TaxID=2907998 RepID=A0ABS9VMC8_9SPHN|nr:glycoside hydrolase family 3 N-terminal domain-containing protein [Sphingomonas telluris]MCH8616120.1 glycoside hydrolase family 3 C-terminal domain-containing protein [Sphingomonas telluris]